MAFAEVQGLVCLLTDRLYLRMDEWTIVFRGVGYDTDSLDNESQMGAPQRVNRKVQTSNVTNTRQSEKPEATASWHLIHEFPTNQARINKLAKTGQTYKAPTNATAASG